MSESLTIDRNSKSLFQVIKEGIARWREEIQALREFARALAEVKKSAAEGIAGKGAVDVFVDFLKCAASVREIKFARTEIAEDVPLPALAHPKEDMGFDLRTAIDFTLAPGEKILVPTGLIFDLPVNSGLFRLELKIEQRTGNGGKGLFAAAKTVDAGYRPDPEDPNGLTLILRNVGNDTLTFKRGEAVAQGIFAIKVAPKLKEVDRGDINYDTDRGKKRFGETGK